MGRVKLATETGGAGRAPDSSAGATGAASTGAPICIACSTTARELGDSEFGGAVRMGGEELVVLAEPGGVSCTGEKPATTSASLSTAPTTTAVVVAWAEVVVALASERPFELWAGCCCLGTAVHLLPWMLVMKAPAGSPCADIFGIRLLGSNTWAAASPVAVEGRGNRGSKRGRGGQQDKRRAEKRRWSATWAS